MIRVLHLGYRSGFTHELDKERELLPLRRGRKVSQLTMAN